MEQVRKELEEMRSEMEALTAECRAKNVLSESLRQAHDEQLVRLQEARAKVEKQAKEINAKEEEISVAKQMYEDLRSKFCEKESALKHLVLANENLRARFMEKVAKLERENKQLVSGLDEANEKKEEQYGVIASCKQEIERLKGLLSMSQKKCVDAEQRAQDQREVRRREEMIVKLERDKGEVKGQLRWKSEQFRHLEEAHDRIQEKFQACRKEWEIEKANLVDKVSSLQTNLDSQSRVAEGFRARLQMCNQALAHEESRRKLLEVQMSESKALYENVMSEYEEARLNITSLTERRDDEIAALRNSLATKATLANELYFTTTHLEQENEELRSSLKELREAQISGVGAAASLKTLQQKFRALEQAHKGCSEKLKARDVEWNTETEKLSSELDDCLLKLSNKDKQLQYLQVELEVCHSSLIQQKLENDEISVVLMILKSKFLESCLHLQDLKHESEQYNMKTEERICLLMEQLEKKNSDLVQAQPETKEERERGDLLLSKAEYTASVGQECHLMKEEINLYKGMLEDSSKNLEQLRQQAVKKESGLLEDIKKALVALDQTNFALADKSNQLSKVEFELEQSKFVVELMEKTRCDLEAELNKCHDESLLIRKDLENSLLAKTKVEKDLEEKKACFLQTLEEKDKKIEGLRKQLVLLEEDKRVSEASFLAKLESKKSSEKEIKKFVQFIEDMDRRLRSTQSEVDSLEQNYILREIEVLMKLEEEKMRFHQVMEEKEKVIADVQQKILSYEQDFTRSVEIAASIKQRDARLELCTLNESLEKTMAIHILDEQEIYYRNILIAELEEEIHALQLKAELGEKVAFGLKNCIDKLEANLATVRLEKEQEQVYFKNEFRSLLNKKLTLEVRAEELEFEKKALYGSILNLSSDREELVNQMTGFGDLIGNISVKGEEIKKKWNMVVQIASNEDVTSAYFEVEDPFTSRKLDGRNLNSPLKIKAGQVPDRRSPLKRSTAANFGRTV